MNAKRLLFLVHRWLGIGFFAFVLLWLVSGIVMMYVGYPKLTMEERVAHGLPLGEQECCQGGGHAFGLLAAGSVDVVSLRFFNHGHPTLVAVLADKTVHAYDGASGELLQQVGADMALRNAARFLRAASLDSFERVTEDAWTHTKSLDPYRPFYRIDIAEGDIAHLYVSALTGEVIRDVTHAEKYWNWLGAWIHWLYLFRGSALDAWWSDILIVLSLGALLLACSGLLAGILRWNRRRYRNARCTPYQPGFQCIHHVFGVFFGIFVVTWLFSGFMSLNPAKIFDSRSPVRLTHAISAEDLRQAPKASDALACMLGDGFHPVEMEWRKTPFGFHVLGVDQAGNSIVYRGGSPSANSGCVLRKRYDENELMAFARQAMPGFSTVTSSRQSEYDWHYYPRGPQAMHGHHLRPLPVLFVAFDDPDSTSLYIDYQTGQVVHRTDDRQKSMRALFKFLHSLDWYPLLASRPAWDIVMLLASLGGMTIGVSGAVLAFRRMRRK